MNVSVEHTPNPNAVKITAPENLFQEGSVSASSADQTEHPVLKSLLSIAGVDNAFGNSNFVTVTKSPSVEWAAIMPEIEAFFDEYGK
ncbi:NifU N-terminal domain-containing protein [Bacillus marinisedimentorum]|uniref:NifU N-terminal domain-containing protein n=1 Tax=Bacillus marinisedimentorum TaxID=1821260 RepID=UPI000871EB2B|nr:NifU N-terminal domain-containing protein [Bacillus marinisedimentorum]